MLAKIFNCFMRVALRASVAVLPMILPSCSLIEIQSRAPRVALVVGESAYPAYTDYVGQAWQPLPVTGHDANAMAELLVRHGYSLVGGGPQTDLTRAGFEAQLNALAAATKQPGSVALVYVSAHGMQENGKIYVAPVDSPQPLEGLPQYTKNRLSVEDIDRLAYQDSLLTLLIVLDICRDVAVSAEPIQVSDDKISPRTVIAMASEPGASVLAHDDGSLSDYTSAFIETITKTSSTEKSLQSLLTEVGDLVGSKSDNTQLPLYKFGSQSNLIETSASELFGSPSKAPSLRASFNSADNKAINDALEYYDPKNVLCSHRNEDGADDLEEQAKLAQPMSLDEKIRFCETLIQRLKDDGLNPERKSEFRSNIHAKVKQAAEAHNSRAMLLEWMFSNQGILSRRFSVDEFFAGDIGSDERVNLEYLERAAEAREPEAMYFYGIRLMPIIRGRQFGSRLPGDVVENYQKGKKYLEWELDAGMADAGFYLAYISRQNLVGLPLQRDMSRSYAERALNGQLFLMEDTDLLVEVIRLGEDYMFGITGNQNMDRALELFRGAYEFGRDHDTNYRGQSAQGRAAWDVVCVNFIKGGPKVDGPEIERMAAEAARLGIPQAQRYIKERIGSRVGVVTCDG